MAARAIQVLLVDDHAVVRAGYRRLLKLAEGIEVVDEADSGEQAYSACREFTFDVVVVDLSLPGMSGIEATKRICGRYPGVRVLVFSVHEEDIFIQRALAAGATGYISKREVAEVLIDAVRAVAVGARYIGGQLGRVAKGGVDPVAELSAREFEIFRLLACGHSINAIAVALHISPKTVANQSTRVRAKLDVANTADLTRLAISTGVVGL